MRLTDEAVEAAARALHHERYPWVPWGNLKPESREYYRNEVRAPLAAAFAHLTDDGAVTTPPADSMGVRCTPAAESATPAPTGDAAPSSPHLPTCPTTYGGSCDGYCKDPTEHIAWILEECADDLTPPITTDWLELRDWFKDQLHELAAKARKIGGAS